MTVAQWLDSYFLNFDLFFAKMMHSVQCDFLNVFFEVFSLLGKGGIPLILLGLALTLFRSTRKIGLGMLLAIACGGLITNLTLKPLVGRLRPYVGSDRLIPEDIQQLYLQMWQAAGGIVESEYSFPSGHTTVATTVSVAVFILLLQKKAKGPVWTVLLFPIVMGAARIYLMVHFASDVLFGLACGTIAGIGGAILASLIYRVKNEKFNAFLTQASVCSLFKKQS